MSPTVKMKAPPTRISACQMSFRLNGDPTNPLQKRRWRLVYALGITVGVWLAWFVASWTGGTCTVCEWEKDHETGKWKFRLIRRSR